MRRIRRFAALLMAVCIIASSVPVISAAQIENAGNDMDDASLRTSVEASGSGSVGRMLADAISEEQAALQASESLGYAITNLTVTGSQIDVSCRSDKTACVMVALYEESGELASFGSADMEAGEQTVTVSISDDIPEFFTASAFMIDPETRTPLCAKYTTTLYTKAMRELSDASIDDYDATLVLNLDDDSDNNFAVFDESVHIIPYQNSVNQIMDNGNGTYIVTAANADFTSLRRGDILAANTNDGETLILRVGQISVNGSTVLITQADEELKLTDVFQVVKIEGGCLLDENGDIPEDEKEAALMDGGIETGIEEKFLDKKPVNWTKKFEGEPGGMDVTVSVSGTVNATAYVKLYVMFDEQYLEASVSFSAEFKAGVSGSSGRLTVPLLPQEASFSPVPGVYISLNPSIVLEASVTMEFSAKATATVGFAYLGGTDLENRSKAPELSKVQLKAEGKFYIGFSLEPKIAIAGKLTLLGLEVEVADASINAEFGVTFSVSMSHDFLDKEHACLQCLKGTATISLDISAQAKFIKYLNAEMTLYKGDLETLECYYSLDYDDFGFGKCPHKNHVVTVTVNAPAVLSLKGATVRVTGESTISRKTDQELTTGLDGKAEIYLPDGKYTFSCESEEYDAKGKTEVTVDGKALDVAVQLTANVYPVTVTVKDARGNPLSGASITGVRISPAPVTDSNGVAKFNVSRGSHTLTVTNPNDKSTETREITVESQALQVSVVFTEKKYQVLLIVMDESGNTVSGASVAVQEMEGLSVTTGSGGSATFEVPNGTYHMTATSADGKLSGSKTVTVSNSDASGQITLTQKTPDTVTVSGSALDAEDNAPLSGAVVTVTKDGETVATVTTGADGNFSVNLTAGSYTLEVTRDGYKTHSETVTVTNSEKTLTVRLSKDTGESWMEWEFDEATGTLTINGSGPMPDYSYSFVYETTAPWSDNRSKIKYIKIKGVTSIGAYAFRHCTSLTSVTIPSSVTSIGDEAFADCGSLTSVTIPNSVASIGSKAFAHTRLISVTIPNSVASIGSEAFAYSRLTSVTIPNRIASIEFKTFFGCENLTSVTIPNSVTSIAYQAFADCRSLKSVIIPNNVTSIGNRAFRDCWSLTSVTISSRVTYIGDEAFYGCSRLTSVTIPNSVTRIENRTFDGCSSLTSVTIPNSVTSIGDDAFWRCSNLTSIFYEGTERQWKAVKMNNNYWNSPFVTVYFTE